MVCVPRRLEFTPTDVEGSLASWLVGRRPNVDLAGEKVEAEVSRTFTWSRYVSTDKGCLGASRRGEEQRGRGSPPGEGAVCHGGSAVPCSAVTCTRMLSR